NKPYKCDLCELALLHYGHLTVHQRVHTGEKTFECDLCEAAFSQNSKSNVHKIVNGNLHES
ncbi:hypothetical protein ScPMuIL_007353, partial [Solemya velum]